MKNSVMLSLVSLYFFLFFSVSCVGDKKDDFSVIDIEKAFEHREAFGLSDIADDISYVPLETTDSSLIGKAPMICVSSEKILVASQGQPLMAFDKKTGRFLCTIGHKGDDPEGYGDDGWGNLLYWLDTRKEVVYIMSNDMYSLLRYDLEGNFLGKTSLGEESRECMDLFSGYLYIKNDTVIVHNKFVCKENVPFILCFLGTTGEILWQIQAPSPLLPSPADIINSEYRYGSQISYGGNSYRMYYTNERAYSFATDAPSIWEKNDQLYFKENFKDTIYQISNGNLIFDKYLHLGKYCWPYEERTNAAISSGKISIDYLLESDASLYFHFHTGLYETSRSGNKSYCGIYIKHTGEIKINEGDLVSDDLRKLPPVGFYKMSTNQEWIGHITASDFLEWKHKNVSDAGVLPQSLQKEINEDDNPIIVVATPKQ